MKSSKEHVIVDLDACTSKEPIQIDIIVNNGEKNVLLKNQFKKDAKQNKIIHVVTRYLTRNRAHIISKC